MRPRLLDYVAAFLAHRGAFLKRLRGLRVDSMSAAELRDALDDTARFGRLRQVGLELHRRLERAQRRIEELEEELAPRGVPVGCNVNMQTDRPSDMRPDCTGDAATWCPNCGDCTCPADKLGRFSESPSCPLHGLGTRHNTRGEEHK